jgi:hypothetical protein
MIYDYKLINDKQIVDIISYLNKYTLSSLVHLFSLLSKFKYAPEHLIKIHPELANDKRFLEKDFIPEFFLPYIVQKIILTIDDSTENRIQVPIEYLDALNKDILQTEDLSYKKLKSHTKKEQSEWIRKMKNFQRPYDIERPYFTKLFRLVKIFCEHSKSYNFSSEIEKHLNIDSFESLVITISSFEPYYLRNLQNSHINPKYFIDSGDLNFIEAEIYKIFELLSFNGKEDLNNILNDQYNDLLPLFSNNESEAIDLLYKHDLFLPPILRYKPLLKDGENYTCPSIRMLSFCVNEMFFRILRKKEKTKDNPKDNEFLNKFGASYESYSQDLVKELVPQYQFITEAELYNDKLYKPEKGNDRLPAPDGCLVVDDYLVMFDYKTFTPTLQSLITGNETKWSESYYEKLNRYSIQLFRCEKIIEKRSENDTFLNGKVKGIKKYYPIIVTYSTIYDINKKYSHRIADCFNHLNEKNKKHIKDHNLKLKPFIILSALEYGLLLELLNKSKSAFKQCLYELFKLSTFKLRFEPKENNMVSFTPEPIDVIFKCFSGKAVPFHGRPMEHDLLGEYYENIFYPKAKQQLITKNTSPGST